MNTKSELVPKQEMLSQVDDEAASAVSLSIDGVTTIPITPLGKYIVTCEISGEVDFQKIQRLAQNLDQWWRSDSKFFVLVENDDIPKIRFERLEDTDEFDAD